MFLFMFPLPVAMVASSGAFKAGCTSTIGRAIFLEIHSQFTERDPNYWTSILLLSQALFLAKEQVLMMPSEGKRCPRII
ncbi:hypothetical protein F5050DRAFT_1739956 [Lentinula boryana]|uniref:Secreted protein n=1 Tax=Lentinula boryana TaxID=40481 RepID=A0ABQ8QKJ6_9AGAR|nr:hypothetical protein F5050DRAFT_1739956 [Lentinula boryana]